MIPFLLTIYSFFLPSIKLESSRQISLNGNGPPVLFHTGLFGSMPNLLYNDLINNIKKNVTLISFKDNFPITVNDIEDVANSLSVKSIGFISHSSFNIDILNSDKINSAVLCDPIVIPEFSVNGLLPKSVQTKAPIYIIKAEKTYDSKIELPSYQIPEIIGNCTYEIYNNVGHLDLLDDVWANLGKKTNFWEGTKGPLTDFKNWKFDKNSIGKSYLNKENRKKYRNHISNTALSFILNNDQYFNKFDENKFDENKFDIINNEYKKIKDVLDIDIDKYSY